MKQGDRDSACLDANTAAAYVTQSLEVSEVRRFDAHVAGCRQCRQRLSELARVQTATPVLIDVTATRGSHAGQVLAPGTRIGRYVIAEPLGAGGMGVVYAAMDSQLERRVAVKMVRRDLSEEESLQASLLREAQAMAKLSHPNVVAVHDLVFVERQLFIAMEIVEGVSLKGWLVSESRPWRKILHAFLEAGRGLAAAHAANFVHRDFKPSNVLCGVGGRVCVTDFGLARPAGDGRSWAAAFGVTKTAPLPITSHVELAQGTPSYMAPEQHRGEAADERSDQFSFCVALYEALYGRHPFPGETVAELAEAKAQGKLRPAPRSAVPSRVRRALERGLFADPARRHPSMDALLGALTHDPRAWRVRIGAAIVALAVAGAIVFQVRHARSERRRVCTETGARLAEVWSDARKKAASDAFAAVGSPFARQAFTTVEAALSRYVTKGVSVRTQTCEAVLLDSRSSDGLRDDRMLCLEDRLRDFEAVVGELARVASVGGAASAAVAAETIEPIESCTLVKPALRRARNDDARAEEVRRGLARARALRYFGKSADAMAVATGLRQSATSLGDDSLLAHVLLECSFDGRATRKLDAAEEDAYRAASLADAVGDDVLRARAWIQLIIVVGYLRSDAKQAARFSDQATAAMKRLGGDARLAADLHAAQSTFMWSQHRYAEALSEARQAVAFYDDGKHGLELARGLSEVCLAERSLDHLDEAKRACERSVSTFESLVGDVHPRVAKSLSNLAAILLARKEFAQALAAAHRAISIYETIGDKAASSEGLLASALINAGAALVGIDRFAEALPFLERSLSILDRLGLSDQPPWEALTGLGRVHLGLHQGEQAIPYLERVVVASPDKVDPDLLAEARFTLSRALTELHKDPRRARLLAVEAKDVFDRGPVASPLQREARDEIAAWLAALPDPAAARGTPKLGSPRSSPGSVQRQ